MYMYVLVAFISWHRETPTLISLVKSKPVAGFSWKKVFSFLPRPSACWVHWAKKDCCFDRFAILQNIMYWTYNCACTSLLGEPNKWSVTQDRGNTRLVGGGTWNEDQLRTPMTLHALFLGKDTGMIRTEARLKRVSVPPVSTPPSRPTSVLPRPPSYRCHCNSMQTFLSSVHPAHRSTFLGRAEIESWQPYHHEYLWFDVLNLASMID
jgi:hypothetical protein